MKKKVFEKAYSISKYYYKSIIQIYSIMKKNIDNIFNNNKKYY